MGAREGDPVGPFRVGRADAAGGPGCVQPGACRSGRGTQVQEEVTGAHPVEEAFRAARRRGPHGVDASRAVGVRRVEGSLAEGRGDADVVLAEPVPQERALHAGIPRVGGAVGDVAVVRGQQHLVSRPGRPPGDVVRHQAVPVAHGLPQLPGIVEVEGVAARGLRQRPRVLDRPGVGVLRGGGGNRPAGEQGQRRLRADGHRPALGRRPGQVGLHVGARRRGGPQSPVQRRDMRQQVGLVPGRVPEHLVVQFRARVSEVVAHETQLVPRMPEVVRAHPLDERQVLVGVPPRVGVLELLPHDASRVALAGPDVGVQPEAAAPARLQREGAEALVLHQVAQHAVLEREELVRAVRCLAEPHHPRVAHHATQGPQVAQVAARAGGAQRVGAALHGRHRARLGRWRVPEPTMHVQNSSPTSRMSTDRIRVIGPGSASGRPQDIRRTPDFSARCPDLGHAAKPEESVPVPWRYGPPPRPPVRGRSGRPASR